MSNLVAKYTHIFNDLADKRVENWPLMSGPGPILTLIAAYMYLVLKAGPRYMETRKPYNLKATIQIYNIFQVVSCVTIIYGVLTNGWTTRMSVFKCHPVDYSNDPMAVRLAEWVWWTLLLKCAELIETVFFVLRKKYTQVSRLHLYHHVSTLMLVWIGVKFVPGGMATFPIIINSFIHVLMYTYYFLSTLGPTWQKKLNKWKPKLTLLQMIQFCIIIMHASIGLRQDCPVPHALAYVFIPNVFLVFYLFYDFYKKAYLKNKTKNQ